MKLMDIKIGDRYKIANATHADLDSMGLLTPKINRGSIGTAVRLRKVDRSALVDFGGDTFRIYCKFLEPVGN